MILAILLMILSLGILALGAEGLVRGSASLALRAGLTPLMVGLTVVAFGTSSPEMVVSVKGALAGQGDLAVGNIVGSNIYNIGVILGLTALLCPVPVKLQILKLDAPIMILVAVALPLLLINKHLGRVEGLFLSSGLVAYTWLNIVLARRETVATANTSQDVMQEYAEGVPSKSGRWWHDALFIVGGLGLLILGSNILVNNCMLIARKLGVSEAVIGLTIIAAGTSMPELATSVIAAIRKQPDIAVGNIVGSNIFNILGILGASALVRPVDVVNIQTFDYLVMIAVSILLLPLLWTGIILHRIEGALLLAIYGGYLYMLWPK